MAKWGRRKTSESTESESTESESAASGEGPAHGELELWSDEDGVLVAGPNANVSAVVAHLEAVGGLSVEASSVVAADALAVFASGYADGATSMQYIRHTARSAELLRTHGAIPTGEGAYRSMVIGPNGIAGNLDWSVVDVGPERALAFQSAAVGLALRTAVRQVEVAVERVEEKVDQIAELLRAERLGDALGDRRTLESLVQRVHDGEGLSAADWSSVAALGPAITRDLEKLRAHVRLQLAEAEAGWWPRTRAAAADGLLADRLLTETMALIVVAEHNFSLWQQLRIERIERHEPDHLRSGVRHARSAMREHLDQDQLLLDQLREVQERLLEPAKIDGLAPRQSRRLESAARELDAVVAWFAEQRLLDVEASERAARPGLRDSLRHVGTQTVGVARGAGNRLRRSRDDGTGDVGTGADAKPELDVPEEEDRGEE